LYPTEREIALTVREDRQLNRKRILLVDDEPFNLKSLLAISSIAYKKITGAKNESNLNLLIDTAQDGHEAALKVL
jgi:hypothetical protein